MAKVNISFLDENVILQLVVGRDYWRRQRPGKKCSNRIAIRNLQNGKIVTIFALGGILVKIFFFCVAGQERDPLGSDNLVNEVR